MPTHNLRRGYRDWQGLRLGINQVNVLFVQDSVRKLFLKAVLVKELFDSPGYDGLLKDLVDMGSP
jgi:hypothetical protein